MLQDAVSRAIHVSQNTGVSDLLAQAPHERARKCYRTMGFQCGAYRGPGGEQDRLRHGPHGSTGGADDHAALRLSLPTPERHRPCRQRRWPYLGPTESSSRLFIRDHGMLVQASLHSALWKARGLMISPLTASEVAARLRKQSGAVWDGSINICCSCSEEMGLLRK